MGFKSSRLFHSALLFFLTCKSSLPTALGLSHGLPTVSFLVDISGSALGYQAHHWLSSIIDVVPMYMEQSYLLLALCVLAWVWCFFFGRLCLSIGYPPLAPVYSLAGSELAS